MHHAAEDQHQHVGRQRADQRARHVGDERDPQGEPASVDVGDLAVERDDGGRGEQVGGDKPGQVAHIVEVAADRRQGARQDGLVERAHERGQQHAQNDQHPLPVGERRLCGTSIHWRSGVSRSRRFCTRRSRSGPAGAFAAGCKAPPAGPPVAGRHWPDTGAAYAAAEIARAALRQNACGSGEPQFRVPQSSRREIGVLRNFSALLARGCRLYLLNESKVPGGFCAARAHSLRRLVHGAQPRHARRQVRSYEKPDLRHRFSVIGPALPDAEGARPPRRAQYRGLRHGLSRLSLGHPRPAVHPRPALSRQVRHQVSVRPQ